MIAHGIALAVMMAGSLAPPRPVAEPDRVAKAERDLAVAETQLAALRHQRDNVGEQLAMSYSALNAATCVHYRAEQAFADFQRNYPAWEADPGIVADGKQLRDGVVDARNALRAACRSVRMCLELADCCQSGVEAAEGFIVLTRQVLELHRRDAGTPARPAAPQKAGGR